MALTPCSPTCAPAVKRNSLRNHHGKQRRTRKIKLESTAGTGHFYTTDKNKKTTPEKLLIKKFDPKARKHVDYKEIKLK